MLDYDAMRSKVKKLTEKPDKDPSKLPRAEKETEMVSVQNSLHLPSMSTPNSGQERSSVVEVDLSVPSPPKAIQRPKIRKLRRTEWTPERLSSINFGHVIQRSASWASPPDNTPDELLQEANINNTPTKLGRLSRPSSFRVVNSQYSSLKAQRAGRLLFCKATAPQSVSRPLQQVGAGSFIAAHEASKSNQLRTKSRIVTPFFQPSELEEIMEPFMLEFIKKQADSLQQAKAAYEQLNEQLTNELPQLIDLR